MVKIFNEFVSIFWKFWVTDADFAELLEPQTERDTSLITNKRGGLDRDLTWKPHHALINPTTIVGGKYIF